MDQGMGKPFLLKRLLPKSLLWRSLLIIVTPMVVLQLVAAFVFYESHWNKVARQLATGLAGDIAMVIEHRRTHAAAEERRWLAEAARTLMLIETSFEDGGILPNAPQGRNDDTDDDALEFALDDKLRRPFFIDTTSRERELLIAVQLADGVVRVAVPKKRLFTSTTYVFVLWMVGTSMVLSGLAILFMRNQVRPIRRLAAAMSLFGKGREVAGFKPEGALEARQAGQAFDLMRQRIGRQIEQRTEMLAGVSHDLRTPLTRMKLQLAMAEGMEGVADLKEDVAEMERMVEGYLAFARGEGTETIRPASLSMVLSDIAGRFRRNGIAIDLHVEQDVILPIRVVAVERCLSNLIANAGRHGKHVTVRAGVRADAVDIVIDDDGPGIPPDKREDVFKAFFRIEGSRNPATGGVGLGLTIARDIARGHGGDILLEDSPLGGLRARVRLPL